MSGKCKVESGQCRNCVTITKYSQYGYVCRGRCLIVPFQSVQLTKIRADVGCGCPVDTSAKQKHRPNRQVRLSDPYICGLY